MLLSKVSTAAPSSPRAAANAAEAASCGKPMSINLRSAGDIYRNTGYRVKVQC